MSDSKQHSAREHVETVCYALDHGLNADLTTEVYTAAMDSLVSLEEQLEAMRDALQRISTWPAAGTAQALAKQTPAAAGPYMPSNAPNPASEPSA